VLCALCCVCPLQMLWKPQQLLWQSSSPDCHSHWQHKQAPLVDAHLVSGNDALLSARRSTPRVHVGTMPSTDMQALDVCMSDIFQDASSRQVSIAAVGRVTSGCKPCCYCTLVPAALQLAAVDA